MLFDAVSETSVQYSVSPKAVTVPDSVIVLAFVAVPLSVFIA